MAGGTALAAYLDAKFHVRNDLSLIYRVKKSEWAYEKAGTCRDGIGSKFYRRKSGIHC